MPDESRLHLTINYRAKPTIKLRAHAQRMMQKVLESIYEPLFHEDSYGFRPGRSCHDALKELTQHLHEHEVETVIDVDLSNYFGSISHEKVMKVIRKKISDPRLLRYLMRMFKSGMLVDGELTISDEGVVQGGLCKDLHNPPYSKQVLMQTNQVFRLYFQ